MKAIAILAAAYIMVQTAGAWGDEPMILPGKQAGDVTFDHQKHMDRLKSCEPCHNAKTGGGIVGFGKEAAHKLCQDCHIDRKAGPTTCQECHKQK